MAPPAHIILNFAVGGQWAGRYGIDAAQFPQAFSIDYVRVCQYLQAPTGHPSCPRSPATPDLGQVKYTAPADMKKPVIRDGTVGPAPVTDDQKPEAASSFLVRTQISNLSSLPSARSITVSLRPAAANGSQEVATSALPQSALLSAAPQSFAINFSVPDQMQAGRYDVLLGIAAPSDAGSGKKPGFTPVTCGMGMPIPKAASCLVGTVDVPARAGGLP